jgi:ATP-dependent helicase/nuclease subunit A
VSRIGTWLLDAGWRQAHDELTVERSARGEATPLAAEIAARACEGLVAITFTEAAAAEMAARVDALLAQAASGAKPKDLDELPALASEERVERAEALLAASSRLRLSTIHGFCHRLLAEAPIEAGLHPAFEVDADGERTVELATGVLLARLRAGAPELVELLAAGVDPPAALEALATLAAAGVAADELAGDPFSAAVLAPRFAALAAALDRLLAVAAPLAGGHKVKSILEGLEALRRLRRALDDAEPSAAGLAALAGELDASADEASKILAGWAAGDFGKTEEKIVGAAPAEVIAAAAAAARAHAALHALDPELTLRARRALAPALAELAARRKVEGVVSFDDLLERAARLLVERSGVRARVRRGIRQLLVDEFQDTDQRQCELLRALVLAPSEAPGPGLFLVGDPKQSIYGWRSADLAAYAGFLDDLATAGARFGRLEVNFRSQPPILEEVERALAPVLVEARGVQAAFQPLRASPEHEGGEGFTAAGRAAVEYWASWDRTALADGGRTASARASEIEAAAIARDVRDLVAAGAAAWGDFALLLRARGDLDLFLDAFRRAGVPYVVQKDRSYYRRREVVDVAAAARAILDPDDLLAAVAFLRSPFVGVPDAAWLPLWRAGFPAALIAVDGANGLEAALATVRVAAAEAAPELPSSARAPGWELSLAAAVEAIAALRADFRRLPAGEWVERLRVRLLLEPIAAARFLGRFGLANLERFLGDLEASLDGEPDPGRALSALRLAIAEERPAEEARPPEERSDAVAVMTIHTAKGLQFRHVYLAQAQRRPGGAAMRTPPVAIGPPGAVREMVLFGAPTPGWPEIAAARRRLAAAEAARLLYVATTRAIDRLVVCGRWDVESASPGAEEVPSFADLLSSRLAAAPAPSPETPAHRDEHGVLWRLADDGAAVDEVAPPAVAGAVTLARHDAVDLGQLRAAALRRSARSRFRPASALAASDPLRPATGSDAAFETRRAVARALGVALHHALELHPLAARDEAAWRHLAAAAPTAPNTTSCSSSSFTRSTSSGSSRSSTSSIA